MAKNLNLKTKISQRFGPNASFSDKNKRNIPKTLAFMDASLIYFIPPLAMYGICTPWRNICSRGNLAWRLKLVKGLAQMLLFQTKTGEIFQKL